MDKADVGRWLEQYVAAWISNDPQQIGDLFSEDVTYRENPYDTPKMGRRAIVDYWLTSGDAPGTFRGEYEPVLVDGNRAVATGKSIYFESDGSTLQREYTNIFLLTFDEDGRCTDYREWYTKAPTPQAGQQ